jgi:hypothetical protein
MVFCDPLSLRFGLSESVAGEVLCGCQLLVLVLSLGDANEAGQCLSK